MNFNQSLERENGISSRMKYKYGRTISVFLITVGSFWHGVTVFHLIIAFPRYSPFDTHTHTHTHISITNTYVSKFYITSLLVYKIHLGCTWEYNYLS